VPSSIGVTSSVLARIVAAVLATTTLTVTTSSPESATPEPQPLFADRIEVVAPEGALLRIGDDVFEGPLVILPRGDGVTAIEALPPEEYLLGIREVPFAWPDEALKTQAVAARTYLAFTLAGGRTATGREHGYDICATTACQVYAGVAGLSSADGVRWRQAIAATAGEILLHEGRPVQALYSSTAGDRTRESEDIFPGLDVPYLAAVDSPGEDSPFVRWSFAVSRRDMTALLDHAGLLNGPLESIRVATTSDGGGPWEVVVTSGGTQERVATYRFRTLINNAARDLMPGKLPANRPDGKRYPQTVLSGTYTIRTDTEITLRPGTGPVWSPSRYVFQGQGWGHQVGMSQYGALAMANLGSNYSDILAHYYGGIRPVPATAWLPDEILVGLVIGAEEITITAEEGASVLIDGEQVAPAEMGIWRFERDGGTVRTAVPIGLGTRVDVARPRIAYGLEGYVLRFDITAPGYVTVDLTSGAERVGGVDLGLVEAGSFEFPLRALLEEEFDPRSTLRVGVTTGSPSGGDLVSLTIVPENR
jgi:stage II sporulation protein D